MKQCMLSVNLAYGMLVYLSASIMYLLITRKIGTPFNDSLTPEQKEIKNKSAGIRRRIFYSSVLFSMIAVYIISPFQTCTV